MARLDLGSHALHYDIIDLVPPWIDKPQTILLHHGMGTTSASWSEWLPNLIDRYRIVWFDIRGHGKSTWAGPKPELTLKNFCDDALAVADAAGLNRFHFVGESLGGTVGMSLGIDHSNRLLSVTVSNGAHRGNSITSTDDFREYIARVGMKGWSDRTMGFRFFDDGVSPAIRRWYEETQAATEAELVLQITKVLVMTDLTSDLPKINVPTLFLSGDSSPFISVQMMADAKNLVPDSEFQVFPRAKHGLPVSHARESSLVMRRFLERRCAV